MLDGLVPPLDYLVSPPLGGAAASAVYKLFPARNFASCRTRWDNTRTLGIGYKRSRGCSCMGRSQEIIVLDSERRFLEYTRPGTARLLLKEGKARVFSRQPFAIMLLRTVSAAEIRRRIVMPAPRNFTEYFRNEKDVYVQNLANAQVSCEFPIGPNRVEGFTFPHNRDPINLTQHIPFHAIKDSMDFRKMLSRRPPALQLLNEEEYNAYFEKRASQQGLKDRSGKLDIDAAIDSSEEKRRRTADKNLRENVTDKDPEPIHEVIESGTGPKGATHFGERNRVMPKEVVAEDDIINPRVLHLCNQVKNEIPEEERMPAKDLLDELQGLPDLKLDDLEHIRAHGFYKSVKKWSKQKMSEISDSEEAENTSADE